MIPKIIHYCWFGRGEKPELAKKCIASWRKFCPDFEIREWNEDNCNYLAMPFMAEAYAAKKYAFVSDVMRLLVLEQYGGVYFDTDVEAVRDIAPLMDDEGFIGFENDQYVASGLTIASVPHHPVVQAMIEEYRKLHFTNADGTTNAVGCPHLNTDIMERYGLVRNGQEQTVAGIHVYPADFFNPLDSVTGKLTKTENTYSIHWYSMSWLPWYKQIKVKIGRIAAYSTGVPTLVVGYSVKARGIDRDLFGTEEGYVLPVQQLKESNELTRAFIDLYERRESIQTHLKTILPAYIARADDARSALEELIKK